MAVSGSNNHGGSTILKEYDDGNDGDHRNDEDEDEVGRDDDHDVQAPD